MKKFLALLLSLALCFASVACGDTSQPAKASPSSAPITATTQSTPPTLSDAKSPEEAPSEEPSEEPVESEEPAEEPSEEPKDEPSDLVDGMRPEFKEFMDRYEEFYMDYCDFMERFNANPSDMKLLLEYTEMLKNIAEMTEALDKWKSDESMTTAELSYLLDVVNRVAQRTLEVVDQ